MSEMEGNVYKQTFSFDEEEDDGDSDSSEEVQYIQATDLPKDELERILAKYKSSLKPITDQQKEYPEESDEETDGEDEVNEQACSTDAAPWLKVLYDDDDDEQEEDPEYESKERRIKRFKEKQISKDQKSFTEVVCDEDTSEEPKVKTIVYKTTYKTYSEQHSSSEESCEEELNDDPDAEDTYYATTYKTARKLASFPEVLLDDDDEDPDYEPKEKRIKRYKTKLKMFREQKLFSEEPKEKGKKSYMTSYATSRDKQSSEVLFKNVKEEDPNTANIRKLKKSSIELQPTPGADYIEIPIPHCNQKFKQQYKPEWEKESYLKDWIQPWLEDSMYAYCKFCKGKLIAHKKSLRDHSNTKKHRKNAFDITGIWGGANSKPANLTFLMPRARRKTGDILLNNYDSSSLNFANPSDFNMHIINDPLLPIS